MTYYDRRDIALQVRARRHLHPLRRLPLLDLRLHQPEPDLPLDRHGRLRTGQHRASRHERGLLLRPRGLRLDDLPRTPRESGVAWQIYQEWDNFTDNAVEYFLPFKKIGTKILASVSEKFRTTEEFYDTLFKKTRKSRRSCEPSSTPGWPR